MDDLIVILLTLLFAVFGVIGQVKKKKQEPLANPVEEMENEILSFLGEDEEITQNYHEPVNEEFAPDNKPETHIFDAGQEGMASLKNKPEEKKMVIIENIRTKKFPLRKAIIYSEIIQNKYT